MKKSTVSVTFTLMDGTEITISDNDNMDGTLAWTNFLHGKGFEYEGTYYNYYAIQSATPTIETEEVEVEDDFCMAGDEPGMCNSLVDEAIVDCSKAA